VPETHVSQTEFCARAYNTRLFARCSNWITDGDVRNHHSFFTSSLSRSILK
jgi:hypothetical protein